MENLFHTEPVRISEFIRIFEKYFDQYFFGSFYTHIYHQSPFGPIPAVSKVIKRQVFEVSFDRSFSKLTLIHPVINSFFGNVESKEIVLSLVAPNRYYIGDKQCILKSNQNQTSFLLETNSKRIQKRKYQFDFIENGIQFNYSIIGNQFLSRFYIVDSQRYFDLLKEYYDINKLRS